TIGDARFAPMGCRTHWTKRTIALLGTLGALGIACGSSSRDEFGTPGGSAAGGADGGGTGVSQGDGKDGGCTGLRCSQQACSSGDTTVTGTVFAPNGKLALYNAIVYVPNATPAPLTKGASCDPCGAVTGDPIVSAISDATGTFVLHNVPVGK